MRQPSCDSGRPPAQLGLSLADRACLALALRLGVAAHTADRAWADIDVGATIVLIR
jgi:ribonuclease VapC